MSETISAVPGASGTKGDKPAAAPAPSPDGFEDSDVTDVFVESTWRGRSVKYDREQQSEPMATKDQANQSRQKVTSGSQTDSANVAALNPDAPLPAHFASFLSSVYPTLSSQLEANLTSHAFDDYLVAWEEERDAVENVFSLVNTATVNEFGKSALEPVPQQKGKKSRNQPVRDEDSAGVLGISWSCNGSVLVAAYGSAKHGGWCVHGGANLSFWNIMRRQISTTRPDFTLETDCCCMCVAYHPERPTILAGGMFNGEVRVWDTSLIDDVLTSSSHEEESKENSGAASSGTTGANASAASEKNPCIMRSSIDDYYHREPISRLEWVKDSAKNWQLVSVSGDGKILFWPMDEPANKLNWPSEGYILSPSEKYSGQKSVMGAARNRFAILGGTAVAFVQGGAGSSADAAAPAASTASSSSLSAHYFVASTEGGGILRIALSNILKRKGYLKSGECRWNRDAYRLVEQSDAGTKFELKKAIEKWSKQNNNESIELETIFAAKPPVPATWLYPSDRMDLNFEGHAGPCYGLAFNRFERNIFASASTDGKIKVFHINNPKPLLTLEVGADYLFGLIWSPSRPLVFAVSDADGRLYIYDLLASLVSSALVIPVNGDKTALQSLAWNSAEPSLIACADVKGRINVFNLAAKYYKIQPGEKRLLEQMANMDGR